MVNMCFMMHDIIENDDEMDGLVLTCVFGGFGVALCVFWDFLRDILGQTYKYA